VNCKIHPTIKNCLVDLFFEDSFPVEREERCALISITRCSDDRTVYFQPWILLSNALYD
jgi:hypothetical protein